MKLSASLLVCATVCAPQALLAQSVQSAFPIQGVCYQLDLGKWTPAAPELRGDTIYLSPPRRLLFDTVVVDRRGRSQGAIWPAPGARGNSRIQGSWGRADSGKVRLIWTNGFSGMRAVVRAAAPDSIVGEATSFWDFIGRPIQRATVGLRPVPCTPNP